MMAMSLTSKVAYKAGCGPFAPEVYRLPYPAYNKQEDNVAEEEFAADEIKRLKQFFKTHVRAEDVAAIIIELVQGEGGFNEAPSDFVRGLRKICDEHGILLIADEVQTGFARTGKLFAMEHHGVVPDLMTIAKSLAGGMPLSGVVGRAEIMDAAAPGGLGGTYAGNPLAVAAAHAVLDIIDDEKLCERATVLGDKLKAKLEALKGDVPQIADVRGPGAMIAVEFCKPGSHEADAAFAKLVQTRALERGLLLLVCGVYSNVVRFLFPLTIQEQVFDEAIGILEEVLVETVGVAV